MSEHHLIHILFIRTDRLGDVLVNLPAIAALRQAALFWVLAGIMVGWSQHVRSSTS